MSDRLWKLNPPQIEHTDEELEKIRKVCKNDKINWNDINVFTTLICDNDVDRDFERFTTSALKNIAKQLIGKRNISNCSAYGMQNTCVSCIPIIIYDAKVVLNSNVKTITGEVYAYIVASCVTLHSEEYDKLLEDITSGVVKETSISCSVVDKRCSICDESNCNDHIKGHKYKNELCYSNLKDISDVYEWSFVKEPDNEPEFSLTAHIKTVNTYSSELDNVKCALDNVKQALNEAYAEIERIKKAIF